MSDEGIITEVLVDGEGANHMYGISYWNEKDIVNVYEMPGGKQKYLDEVTLDLKKKTIQSKLDLTHMMIL